MAATSLEEFLDCFAEAVEGVEREELEAGTVFRELEVWDSLAVLNVLSAVDETYGVNLTGNEMRSATTIRDLFELVQSKVG